MHGEEIGRVVERGDQRELVVEALPHFVGDAVGIAPGRARIGEMRQRLLRRGEACARLFGIFVAQLVEREGESLGQAQRLGHRLGTIAEQPRHFGGRLQMAFGIDRQPAASIGKRQVLADAGEHILQWPPLGRVIEHVVDRDQRTCARRAVSASLASRARSSPR